MPTTTIFCPACNHKLRVPDELMAQPVQCPKCGATFTAPPPASVPGLGGAHDERGRGREADEGYRPHDYGWEEEERQPESGARVVVPAVFLMIIAGLGMLSSIARIAMALFLPKMVEQLQADQTQLLGPPPVNINMRALHIVAGSVFALLSLVTLVGGIAMVRRQFYGLAIAGCVAAMINLSDGCCLLGLPVGIWALVVLLKPDVKASF